MYPKTKKLISLVLVMAFALGLSSVASAAYTMYATDDVNVRSGPGTNYTVIGSLDEGDSIVATGNSVNGWTQVQYSSYEQGYVISSALSYTRPVSSTSPNYNWGVGSYSICRDCGDIYYATTALNVRSGPGTKYSIIGSLAKNQQVTRIGKSGNWYKILTSNGVDAYASASYLEKVGSGSASSSSSSGSYVSYGTYYTTTGLNVRKGPGTGYSVIDTLRKGAAVTYLGEKDGKWLKVRTASGLAGWCHGSYLSTRSVGTVVSGSTCIPSSICGYCGKLYYGTSCTYCYDNGWYWGGYRPYYYYDSCYTNGYVRMNGIYYTRGTTTIYPYSGSSFNVPANTKVQVFSFTDSDVVGVKILSGDYAGRTGNVSSTALY